MATCRDCFHWEACKTMFEASGGIIADDDFKGGDVRCKNLVSAADVAPRAEWISVEERLPERELQELMRMNPLKVFPCLVVIMGDYYNKAYVSKAYYAEEGFISGGSGLITERITHWMPLPEPPEDKR